MEWIELAQLKPAPYNPRKISAEDFEVLQESLKELGVVKPIIVNKDNNVIIAGHQRTKAMMAIGLKKCPAYFIRDINIADEIRFNQLHNKCEYEIDDEMPSIKVELKDTSQGFQRISTKDIVINKRKGNSILNNVLCQLITKYGEFGCPICDKNGKIIVSAGYAYAAKLTLKEMDIYVASAEQVSLIQKYFSREYGVFSYEGLKRNTYVQGFAQMKRLRDGKKGQANSMRSRLYETQVLPYINGKKDLRILDFGAGMYDYALKLKLDGYDIMMVDPYHRYKGTRQIDFGGNKRKFLQICRTIQDKGLFDIVICDSVLNSVDCIDAENAVIDSVISLCKVGGVIFMSGRCKEFKGQIEKLKNSKDMKQSYVAFFDENNFTANYRDGNFFFQKFHDKKMREQLAQRLGDSKVYITSSSFQIVSTKTHDLPLESALKALRYEFDLPLPNGERYGLADEIENAYKAAIDNAATKG